MQAEATEKVKTLAPKASAPKNYLRANKLDRAHVFIDAMNMMGMLRKADRRLDFTGFLEFLQEQTRLIRCSYYVLLRDDIPESATKTISMMEYAGYDVNRKWIDEFQDPASGHFRSKGTVVPEMTVGILDAVENGADHIFVLTGDAEMQAAINAAKLREARVTLLGIQDAVSDGLKRDCDDFIDIIEDLPAKVFLR
jgi:uncharacterized LabA/DUF88 family protein